MRTDREELDAYRLVIPAWLYSACLREFQRQHGNVYKLVKKCHKESSQTPTKRLK